MTRPTPAKFLEIVKAQPNADTYRVEEYKTEDIFNSRKKYKLFRIYTFDLRNIRVYVEYMNGFVRVHVEGTDTGCASWSVQQLAKFSMGVQAAYEILVLSNLAGANQQ